MNGSIEFTSGFIHVHVYQYSSFQILNGSHFWIEDEVKDMHAASVYILYTLNLKGSIYLAIVIFFFFLLLYVASFKLIDKANLDSNAGRLSRITKSL